VKPQLDWSAYKDAGMGDAYADIPRHGGNFARAVAVCINSRQCETIGKQVMCPSFQVTGNPNLSTGGRVRLLKAALSNDLVDQALADPVLAEAMDLCIACKGCKRECEANVDMALIKAEYLAQCRARNGSSVRARLFAHLPRWLHRWPWLKGLIRWRNHSPWLARLGQQLLGIAADRALPQPAPSAFEADTAIAAGVDPASNPAINQDDSPADRKPHPDRTDGRPEVVLFVDTFTRHFEPSIAHAAIAVLNAGGYRVQIAAPVATDAEAARPLCCGRTYLAQGMVEEARAEVRRLVDALLPQVRAGRLVVGLEASCVLGLRDDARALGLDANANSGSGLDEIAGSVLLFEEFLAKEIMAKRLTLPLRATDGTPTLVHGHCHQKAVGATKAMRRVLKLIPGHAFSMIEAGCCGMAGSFGLEAEHAAMATALAEEALLPALRAAPDARVVANGFSCRAQMRAHGDHRARHLAVLLRDALAQADAL
jgi:glycerol-3-phosphate dehydrogenase subunit C